MEHRDNERGGRGLALTRWKYVSAAVLTAVVMLSSGCDQKPQQASSPKGVLKIAFGSEESFQHMYADYFIAKFPELEVQIIPTQDIYGQGKDPLKEYMKLVDEQRPDLLFTNSFDYDKLASTGRLYDLSPLVAKDHFDIENLLPAAVDYLKIKGQGKLYGLAPSFSSSVMFYNKDLFDRYQIPYPTDRMTWEDMFRLAARFPADGSKAERIYGFHMGYMKSPQDFADYIGQTQGLSLVDAEGKKLLINTEAWKRIYTMVIEGYKSGMLQWTYSPEDKTRFDKEDVEAEDLFSAGRSAMTISNIGQISGLKQRGATFAWSMTSTPSADPNHKRSPNFYLYPIFSINAQAENVTNAWEVVKFFNSAEAARIEAKTSVELPVRKAFAKEMDGHSLEPFYQISYDETTQASYNESIPRSFGEAYRKVSLQQVSAMMKGEVSVDKGLQQLQEQGQLALDEAWAVAAAGK
ncbi:MULTISPECIES: ABC transporter substrate-binding protein [unclassified Paenibacillus]|uniref:ABC transporter substrate-binding protein n=1 Tax=unclassified Paenibacillus TaxID=185978 RepID=UPI00364241C7